MQVCWQAGEPMSVRAVLDVLNRGRAAPLAYTTVMSVLTKLADKGLLARTPQGRRFLYTPTVADGAVGRGGGAVGGAAGWGGGAGERPALSGGQSSAWAAAAAC